MTKWLARFPPWWKAHRDAVVVAVIFVALWGATWVQNAHTQAVQRAQGAAIERKLCLTIGQQAAAKAPSSSSSNPATNPSRVFLQGEQRTWRALLVELGCPE